MSNPRVVIVVLNWNGLEDTTELLRSLQEISYANYEVVVVDNCSDADDVQVLQERFGDYVQVVRNDRNYGCGEGFNRGMRHVLAGSRPEFILIVNNDLVVAPDFLDELVRAAESDRRVGIVGPKIYHYDYGGRRDVIWSAGGRIRWWALKVHDQLGEDDDDLPAYQTETEVDWISGCVMMFRSSLTDEIGLLNPWYFIGHEDVEYCLKAKKAGYKVVYVPTSRAWHKVGASRKKIYITFADPSSYYYLVRHTFPLPVYIYQVLLMPALMSRWALLYLARHRDPHTLRRFLADFARMLWRRG